MIVTLIKRTMPRDIALSLPQFGFTTRSSEERSGEARGDEVRKWESDSRDGVSGIDKLKFM